MFAALSALGPIAGGILQYQAQREANQTNRDIANEATITNVQEAQKNRDFQAEMSNTAYQRATKDMQLAGLNPMLAYQQGGASSPAGATASAQSASVEPESIGDSLNQAVTSAMEAKRLKADLEKTGADVDLAKAAKQNQLSQAAKSLADAKLSAAQLPEANAKATIWSSISPTVKKVGEGISSSAKDAASKINQWMDDSNYFDKINKQRKP